jgi:hypothetical protein
VEEEIARTIGAVNVESEHCDDNCGNVQFLCSPPTLLFLPIHCF